MAQYSNYSYKKKGRTFTVVLDGSGTATAISVIKGLKKQNKYKVKIVAMDMNEMNAGRFFVDKFYVVPSASAENFIEKVLQICEEEKADIFVPIIDTAFLKLSQNRDRFKEVGAFLLLANKKALEITSDKLKTHEFFMGNNIPAPRVFKGDKDLDFPVFVKPRVGGRASINAFKVENSKELELYLSKIPDLLIQEYIEGDEFTADCLNSLDGKRFIECIVRKRVETKGGVSVKAEIISGDIEKRIKEYIASFSVKLEIPGAYNVQGFVRDNGDILFTEINPRFAGTHAFTIEAGLNSIEYILDMFCGVDPDEIKGSVNINYNLKMVRYWDEIFIDGEKVFNPWNLWR
ncbi:MAG TPA: ATP-grasp domain-containing protein [Persephonella sp.]|nr:ATP-grasp domain-containing protein [Persephonella sp.]